MVVPHIGLAHCWSICCFISAHDGFSHRCVGVGYALRVSPAVTRLTVCRRPQVGVHPGEVCSPIETCFGTLHLQLVVNRQPGNRQETRRAAKITQRIHHEVNNWSWTWQIAVVYARSGFMTNMTKSALLFLSVHAKCSNCNIAL